MHGITLLEAPADWEILQQENGYAKIHLKGTFRVHPAAIEVGVAQACPVARVMNEDDNSAVIPWTKLNYTCNEDFTGTFDDEITIPAGGLYRIETSLKTDSTRDHITWLYRGDCVLHIGVGNLFIIAGQSNSAGYARDYCMDPPHLSVHLFRNRSKWDLACHPMNESTFAGSLANEEMGIPGVSPYLSFAKKFNEYSHYPVGLIQTALGGSPISRWNPNSGDLYANMLDKIKLTKGRYAGVLWYQGCSDADKEHASSYLKNFTDMVEALRKELGYDIPFFTFQINRYIDFKDDESWAIVREAQRIAAETLPKTYILPTINNAMSDGIHNSAHANMMLGEKLAKQAAHYLLGMKKFEAPALKSADILDDGTICLTFSNVELAFICASSDPDKNGFSLEDEDGPIKLTGFRGAMTDRNHIYLTPERKPGQNALLSFGWEADPVRFPIVDEVTFLPPLSFYKIPIRKI